MGGGEGECRADGRAVGVGGGDAVFPQRFAEAGFAAHGPFVRGLGGGDVAKGIEVAEREEVPRGDSSRFDVRPPSRANRPFVGLKCPRHFRSGM